MKNFLFSEKYLNTLANLTLSGNNGALSNKSFSEKKEMNVHGLEQGYRYSHLWLNRLLREIAHWDISTLEKRFELIVERFIRIWPFPEIQMDKSADIEEQALFDADSPTHRKLEYFIF